MKKEAIETAFNFVELDDIEEWDAYMKVVEGNIYNGLINEPEVEEVELERRKRELFERRLLLVKKK